MKLYTVQEIIEDIFNFEGIKVEMSEDVKIRSTHLYSEIYKKPLSEDDLVDTLKSRMEGFLQNDFNTILPDVDVEPIIDDHATIYISNSPDSRTERILKSLSFYKSFHETNEQVLKSKIDEVLGSIIANTVVILFHKERNYKVLYKNRN